MSLYIDFVQPVQPWTKPVDKPVLEIMAEVYKASHEIQNTTEMVRLCILEVGRHKQLIQGITFASHGSSGAFFIGEDRINIEDLDLRTAHSTQRHIYPALKALRPYFARRNAWVRIDACSCAKYDGGISFLQALSQLLGVTVLGFDEDQIWEKEELGDPTVTRPGKQVVCVARMCHSF